MKEKCNKYEALFTFADENTLNEHLKVCADCRKEQEKMEKVSELLEKSNLFTRKRKLHLQI